MFLLNKNYIINVESHEIADLYFEEFKANKSFAKTTIRIIKKLNELKKNYTQHLEDYKQAYELIDKNDATTSEEQYEKLIADFSAHSKVLQNKIDYYNSLKNEVYSCFKENQTQILENFSNNQKPYSFEQKNEIVKSADELVSLFSQYVSTKDSFKTLLKEGNPVTEDEMMFFDSKVNSMKAKLDSFPFCPDFDYTEMICLAKQVKGLQIEEEKE